MKTNGRKISGSKVDKKAEEPLISIIVPIYNIDKYLKRCIDSILNQTYNNLQIILIDDGSMDRSGDICDEYMSADTRIQVIHKSNGGLVTARKAGMDCANGEYIGFVDGDDFIEPEMFQALLKQLIKDQVDFVHSGYKRGNDFIYGVETEAVYQVTENNILNILNEVVFGSANTRVISPSIWSKLFKRNIIIDSYRQVPDNQAYGEDLLCLCNCILRCSKFSTVNKAYYHYIARSDSICHEKTLSSITREYSLYQSLCGLFEKHGCLSALRRNVDLYFIRGLSNNLGNLTGVRIPQYRYPDVETLFEQRVVIFGAGKVGEDFYLQISKQSRCHIVAWADTNYKVCNFDFCEVIGIEELLSREFDVIVIGVLMEQAAEVIQESLCAAGVPKEKIRWRKPEYLLTLPLNKPCVRDCGKE